jgi:TRAP-type C4-dicarboxylate transport system substrate-binding protein
MILDSPPANQLISKTPIRTLADFKGKKVRTIPAYNNLIKSLGAEPISLPSADLYQSLQKGIIDAAITGANDFVGLKLIEVAKYYTALNLGNTAHPQKVFNIDSWNKLPPDIQKIFTDNFDGWKKDVDASIDAVPQQGLDYAKANGAELISFSAVDQAAFTAAVDVQMKLLATDLDSKGLPGTKIFEAVRASVTQATK